MAHLPQAKALGGDKGISGNLQYDVVLRLSNLETIPAGVVEEIDTVLQREMLSSEGLESKRLGGRGGGGRNCSTTRTRPPRSISSAAWREDDPELAEQIRQLMFVFEDLIAVDDRGIRTLLKEGRNEDLTVALKTASESLNNKVLSNVSERAAAMIKEDLEVMGPGALKRGGAGPAEDHPDRPPAGKGRQDRHRRQGRRGRTCLKTAPICISVPLP